MKSLENICRKCHYLKFALQTVIDIDNSIYSKDFVTCCYNSPLTVLESVVDTKNNFKDLPFYPSEVPLKDCPFTLEYISHSELGT